MSLIIVLITFIVTLLVVGWWHTTYWKRRGVPGPPLLPFLGILDRLGDPKNPNVLKYNEWTKKYGKTYGIQKGRTNILITSDKDMVNEMYTTKFEFFHERERNPIFGDVDKMVRGNIFRARGKRWKRLRTLTNPVFSVINLKKIFPLIEDSAHETIKLLEQTNGKEFDIHPYSHEFTMDVISQIALGQNGSFQFKNDYTRILIDTLNGGSWAISSLAWMIPPLAPLFAKLAFFRSYLRKRGFAVLLKKINQVVAARKKARESGELPEENIDFIDFFLNVESNNVEREITGVYDKSNVQVTKKLTFDEVLGQLSLFLIAGFDTTANTISFSMFYLAKHPEVQDKLRREIEEHCFDQEVSYEDLSKLKYAEAVMKEVLRLHPIAALALNRTAAKDVKLGNMLIEEGTCVHVDVFAIHYSKEIWGEDAEEFNPDRWFREKVPNDWYPFGGGPRICIGMRLAYIEEKLLLVHILRRFYIKPASNIGDKLTMVGNAVLNPENVFVRLEDARV